MHILYLLPPWVFVFMWMDPTCTKSNVATELLKADIHALYIKADPKKLVSATLNKKKMFWDTYPMSQHYRRLLSNSFRLWKALLFETLFPTFSMRVCPRLQVVDMLSYLYLKCSVQYFYYMHGCCIPWNGTPGFLCVGPWVPLGNVNIIDIQPRPR